LVGDELVAGKPRPIEGVLSLLDPLFGSTSAIVVNVTHVVVGEIDVEVPDSLLETREEPKQSAGR
jgi:hypothetical protein